MLKVFGKHLHFVYIKKKNFVSENLNLASSYDNLEEFIDDFHDVIEKENNNQQILDVGIAEEHATVLSSAMVQNNNKVILMMYSTFAQRAYDFVLNDIARTNTNVIIGIDRADFVPGDGSTHQGIYDISMFNVMPNVQILAPRDSK